MRKRFTDSDLFAKSWFRKLSAQEKVLWFYVTQTNLHQNSSGINQLDHKKLLQEM